MLKENFCKIETIRLLMPVTSDPKTVGTLLHQFNSCGNWGPYIRNVLFSIRECCALLEYISPPQPAFICYKRRVSFLRLMHPERVLQNFTNYTTRSCCSYSSVNTYNLAWKSVIIVHNPQLAPFDFSLRSCLHWSCPKVPWIHFLPVVQYISMMI